MESARLRFGDYELNAANYELRRRGRQIKLERIPMELLMLLLERRGQLVTREEIVERLWGKNVFLDVDNSVNTAMRKLCRILRDNHRHPTFLLTVTGKGYRLVAPIHGAPDRAAVTERRAMLAALPFESLSNNANQEYFSDGLTEETISRLGQINPEQLGVIARTSSMIYKGAFYAAMGNARTSFIDIRDIAMVAAKTLTSPEYAGKTYELNGPEALTYAEVAGKISRASGRKVQYVDIPAAQQKQSMLDQRMPEWLVTALLDLQAYYTGGKGGEVDDVVPTILGRAPRTMDQFLAEFADNFGAQTGAA